MVTDEWKQAHPHKKKNKRRGPGGGPQPEEPAAAIDTETPWLEIVENLYSPSDRPDWVVGQLLTCVKDDPMSKLECSDGAFFEYWSNVHYSECIITVDKALMAKRNPSSERNYHAL